MKEISLEAVFVDSTKFDRYQLIIHPETGLILDIAQNLIPRNKLDYIYDDDCYAYAGFGDIHIHAREDVSGHHLYKEDFTSAGFAALNGGVVHVADMPNNPIPPIDDHSYKNKFLLTHKAPISYLLYAGIGPGTRPLSYDVPYKVYMGPSIGDLFSENKSQLEEVLEFYRGKTVSFHCEDPEILSENKNLKTHHERRPIQAELVATADALKFIEQFDLKGKLCHYSSRAGLDLIRSKRRHGVNVQIEATPQHLYYALDKTPKTHDPKFQMNPPLRFEEDRHELLQALKKGEINYLATDHAPHSPEEKECGTSGLTGLDTFGSFITWLLVNEAVKPQLIASIVSENPGLFVNKFLPTLKQFSPHVNYGLGFGFLKAGFRGDVTILNLKKKTKITKEFLKTKALDNPFVGETFPGRVEAVFLSGRNCK